MNILLEDDGRLRAIWRFAVAVVFSIAANSFALMVAQILGRSPRRFDLVYRPTLMFLLLVGYSLLLIGLDRVRGHPLAAMGLGRRGPWLRDTAVGLLLGAGMIVAAVVVIAFVGSLNMHLSLTSRTAKLAAVELVILVSGALAEELMFRGYPFQRLVEAVGATGAIIFFSVLFGAVHLRNPYASAWGFVNTLLVGVLFSIAYLRTRSLWMPWAMHFAWNIMLGLVFGLPVSGLTDFAVLVQSQARGPVWLTGGSYGIEASALGSVVIVLGGVAVLLFVPKREVTKPTPQVSPKTADPSFRSG
jgi:membrane protease YdiL (CAAX protease family)